MSDREPIEARVSGSAARVSYFFESAALPEQEFHVVAVEVEEALNEPYRASVQVMAENRELGAEDLLGGSCVLSIQRDGAEHRVCGIARRVDESSPRDDEADDILTVEIVPALALLALRRDSRIFQDITVPDILEAVLGEALSPYDREVRIQCAAPYLRREYCLQHDETDLAFVERLMEEEGISYAFEHGDEVEVLVLRDDARLFGTVPTADGVAVPYVPDDRVFASAEALLDFHPIHRLTTTQTALRDFDWTIPRRMRVNDDEAGEDLRGRVREVYEHTRSLTITHYAESIERYGAHDAQRQATVRHELHRRDIRVAMGFGRVIGFAPGLRFEIAGHPNLGADGEYLITRVIHESAVPPGRLADADRYHNRFECIPAAVPFRPDRRTPKPRIHSVQSAVVVGPPGEEIHPDEHGRIKVEFHWDRLGSGDEHSSCWIRVQQPWAGAGWGFSFIPRIGMEVIVSFLDGDPDRPLVIGSVYNGTNRPPYALPEEKTKSTIKTRTSPGGGGYNELRFEDKAEEEEIWLHGQKDWNTHVRNDVTEEVGRDRRRQVVRNERVTIGGNHTQSVGLSRKRGVGVDETVKVGRDRSVKIGRDDVKAVGHGLKLTVGGATERSYAKDVREDMGQNHVSTVTEQRVLHAKRVVIDAESEILLKSGSSFISIKPDQIVIEAYQTMVNCEQSHGDASLPGTEPALSDEQEEQAPPEEEVEDETPYLSLLPEELRGALDTLAELPALPPLSQAARAITAAAETVEGAARALHDAGLDADAITVLAMGLPLGEAVSWAQGVVSALGAPGASVDQAILGVVGEWAKGVAEDVAEEIGARLGELSEEVDARSPARWLARAVLRGALDDDSDSPDAQVGARYAVLSAVGLAAAEPPGGAGSYGDRLSQSVELAPGVGGGT